MRIYSLSTPPQPDAGFRIADACVRSTALASRLTSALPKRSPLAVQVASASADVTGLLAFFAATLLSFFSVSTQNPSILCL